MFGIGLPEFILILIVALLVVGPERLPDLARTLAKQVVELKRAANALKESLAEADEPESVLDRPPRDFTVPEGFSVPGALPEAAGDDDDDDDDEEDDDREGMTGTEQTTAAGIPVEDEKKDHGRD